MLEPANREDLNSRFCASADLEATPGPDNECELLPLTRRAPFVEKKGRSRQTARDRARRYRPRPLLRRRIDTTASYHRVSTGTEERVTGEF
jgi:hypothetical protein